MDRKDRLLKIFTVFIAAVFLCSNTEWAGAGLCLRPQAALERLQRVTFEMGKIDESAIYTAEELAMRREKNASGRVDEWLLLKEVSKRVDTGGQIEGDEIDTLIGMRYYNSPYIRRCVIDCLKRVSRAQPNLISAHAISGLRRLIEQDDFNEDVACIARVVREDKGYVERSLVNTSAAPEIRYDDLTNFTVEYIGGQTKRNYKVTFNSKKGEAVLLISVYRDANSPIPVMAKGEVVCNLEVGAPLAEHVYAMATKWREIEALPEIYVPKLGDVCFIEHPNWLALREKKLSYRSIDRGVFLVSREFVEGPTLEDILKSDIAPDKKERALLSAMKTVIGLCQRKRIYTGDPVPTNIMYSKRHDRFLISDLDIMYHGSLAEVVNLLARYSAWYPQDIILAAQRAVLYEEAAVEGARLMLRSFPGPVPFESVQNAKGDTVVEGIDHMMQLLLQARGCEKETGRTHIMPPAEVIALVKKEVAKDPFTKIEKRKYKVLEGGQEREVEREVIYNRLYHEVAFKGKTEFTKEEMQYLFSSLEEDSVSYLILLFLKGAPARLRYLAGRIDQQDTAGAHERDRLLSLAQKYEALWQTIGAKADGILPSCPLASPVWDSILHIRIESWSGLELGDPAKKPFRERMGGIGIDLLYSEVIAVANPAANNRVLWSISGIRAVMGGRRIFGNLTLPQNYDSDAFQDTVPTDAMLVVAATQAAVFADLLKMGPEEFCRKYEDAIKAEIAAPLDEARHEKYLAIKKGFIRAWEESQRHKPVRGPREPPKVLIEKDSRSSGSRLADVQLRALLASGIAVEYSGTGSVCEAAVATLNTDYNGSFVDTASHNPKGHNGLKPFSGTGEVFNPSLAPVFMAAVKDRLSRRTNTSDMIQLVNEGVDVSQVVAVYDSVDRVKERCVAADWTYRKQVITGTKDPKEIERRIEEIRKFVTERKLAVVINPNGGARQDAEFYREVIGFHVIETNGRPRVDMVGPLCPHAVALSEAQESLLKIKEKAEAEGYTIVWYQYTDTDGDRINKMFFDEDGNLVARPDMPQILFAMDAISCVLDNYDFENHRPRKPIAIACNDATATLLEGLAERFGFIIIRSQTGEAMVVDAMNRINNMTFGEAKRLDMERRNWRAGSPDVHGEIYVPKCLHKQGEEWFGHLTDAQHPTVDDLVNEAVMGGEGSNGSDFTFALLVRDPLNKMKMALGFLNPVSGPVRVKEFFERLGRTITDDALKQWWTIDTTGIQPGKNIGALLSHLIRALPKSRSTDVFSPGSGVKAIPPMGMPEPMKRHLDELLSTRGGVEVIRSKIADIVGVSQERITYKPVSSDDICRIGWGAGPAEISFGRMPRDGGYAVRFYVLDDDDWEMPLCAMWTRESLTEIGTLRMMGYGLLSETAQDEIVERLYQLMEGELSDVVDEVITLTVKEMLETDPAHPSGALAASIASLPRLPGGENPFIALQNRLRTYMGEAIAARPGQDAVSSKIGKLFSYAIPIENTGIASEELFLRSRTKILHGERRSRIDRYIMEAATQAATPVSETETEVALGASIAQQI